MTTITREQLIEKLQNRIAVTANYPGVEEAQLDAAIFKIALASLEAEPIGYMNRFTGRVFSLDEQPGADTDTDVYEPVYAAPPAPVAPEKMNFSTACNFVQINGMAKEDRATLAMRAWNACRAAMLHGAEPVSQTYNLPELIEGMEVSIDVSTCDTDAGNRYFGTVTEVSELYTAKNGYILLVQDAEPNFDVNGNSPVTPDGWISCSERMPAQDDWVLIYSKHGEYLAGQVQGEYVELNDGTLSWLGSALHWMLLPEPPQEVK
ncbi:DUF551 domain-containing protein [Salmonella enterica]|nr:DUF551 domain-containing protein [Salmonella enterica]ECH9069437.1 DUF551 domain-containing protein [Salmonella enterica subsp. enterica]EAM3234910.1 DUF551 domain-containing protein [Salmonella enterica]EBA2181048.1 DUF551 domain-containing protein [Salmonella enterica]EBP2593309.1 DUF551 domain-containing protein [Salmonella enterica]